MKLLKMITSATLGVAMLAGSAIAQDPMAGAIGARQSMMRLMGFNIGTLGGMAQGKIAYDASTAQAAADNLAKLASLDHMAMFPKGSDDMSVGDTAAKPDIWENAADFDAKFAALVAGANAMQAAAGGGVDSLKGAMGGLGGACGACHKAYRTPKN